MAHAYGVPDICEVSELGTHLGGHAVRRRLSRMSTPSCVSWGVCYSQTDASENPGKLQVEVPRFYTAAPDPHSEFTLHHVTCSDVGITRVSSLPQFFGAATWGQYGQFLPHVGLSHPPGFITLASRR